jgi:hypothetical protein
MYLPEEHGALAACWIGATHGGWLEVKMVEYTRNNIQAICPHLDWSMDLKK